VWGLETPSTPGDGSSFLKIVEQFATLTGEFEHYCPWTIKEQCRSEEKKQLNSLKLSSMTKRTNLNKLAAPIEL
jgi:lysine/ornithine N-monooxygenase